mmetsp:Transcript_22643/g.42965  ORF Transcript_22643/g.42965 Transcript_22643/m.42965 type:complete len:80 (-) Transcript_22643:8-247(-)|eukprot:scaffold376_cov156-Amphora_coffeaeformis.AAC.13
MTFQVPFAGSSPRAYHRADEDVGRVEPRTKPPRRSRGEWWCITGAKAETPYEKTSENDRNILIMDIILIAAALLNEMVR